jgi:ammonium transporter, Amt family
VVGSAAFLTTFLAWWILRASVGIRVPADEEIEGLDAGEHGIEAYAAFVKVSQE